VTGSTVSHYRILENLGSGGMGIVYKARDLRLNRFVALKFLPPDFARDSETQTRFAREAKAASSLQHNNICTVHDIDRTDDGRLFIVMDYYEGETLNRKIERGPMAIDDVYAIAGQIARGLAQAHAAGIVHRDIKPANIMVTADGVVKILDFGLAKLAGQTRLTREGSALGTIAYMSPEQIRGEDVDHRADIWSFGVVLFEMLTQHLPFRGDSVASMMYTITNESPVDLRAYRGDVPGEMEQVCTQCLMKSPPERAPTLEHVLSLLGMTQATSQRHGLVRPRLDLRRHWPGAAALAAGLGALVLLILLRGGHSPPALGSERAAIGILVFANETVDPEAATWPRTIQSLFFDGLAGTDGLAVLDPTSLNDVLRSSMGAPTLGEERPAYAIARKSTARFVVDGSIGSTGSRFTLHMRIVDLRTDEIGYAGTASFRGRDDLGDAVDTLCRHVVDFVRLQILPKGEQQDLRPWLPPRRHNLAALNAFITATDYKYRGDTTATAFLRRALMLDSTFIAPRVWLVSDLMYSGNASEAQHHAGILAASMGTARPFERVMIQWAAACVAADTAAQIRFLRSALGYSPGNNILLYILARLLYTRGDYAGVIEALRGPADARWPYSRMYYLLAASYTELDQQDTARSILESSLSMAPVYPETYRLLILLCDSAGDTAHAAAYERTYIAGERERGRSTSALLVSLARSGASWGLSREACRWYDAAIALSPESTSYRREYIGLLHLIGDTAKAAQQTNNVQFQDSARRHGAPAPARPQ